MYHPGRNRVQKDEIVISRRDVETQRKQQHTVPQRELKATQNLYRCSLCGSVALCELHLFYLCASA